MRNLVLICMKNEVMNWSQLGMKINFMALLNRVSSNWDLNPTLAGDVTCLSACRCVKKAKGAWGQLFPRLTVNTGYNVVQPIRAKMVFSIDQSGPKTETALFICSALVYRAF